MWATGELVLKVKEPIASEYHRMRKGQTLFTYLHLAASRECAQACTACADACLSEDQVAELTKCIRTNLDCADQCDTTGRVLSRHTGYDVNLTRAVLEACAAACKTCGDECEQHAGMHDHCRVCAEACQRCEQACRDLVSSLG